MSFRTEFKTPSTSLLGRAACATSKRTSPRPPSVAPSIWSLKLSSKKLIENVQFKDSSSTCQRHSLRAPSRLASEAFKRALVVERKSIGFLFFKFNFFVGLLAVCSLLLVSCSNEEIDDGSLNVSLAYDTKCFDGFLDRWTNWSRGYGTSEGVKKDLNCVSDGVSYFLLRVRGEKLGAYNSNEIFNFTQKFFDDSLIEKKTIDDLLMIKSWFLGGSNTEITFEELNKIYWFVKSSTSTTMQLTPLAEKIFFRETKTELTDAQAMQIKQALTHINKEFKVMTGQAKTFVSNSEFEAVINRTLHDLDVMSISKQDISSVWNILSIVTGKSEKSSLSFNPNEGVSDLAFRALYIAVRFKYGVQEIGWRNLSSYIHLESAVNESLALLRSVLDYQPTLNLSKKNLFDLLLHSSKLVAFDFEVTESLIDTVSEIAMSKYFKSDVLGQKEVDQLAAEWSQFSEFHIQTLVLQGLGFTGSLSHGQNFVSLSDVNRRTLDFVWPMLSNSEGYVLNPLVATEITADYGNLFWINWQKALSSIFIKAYAQDNQRRDDLVGVTIDELTTGYADVFKVLNSIDFLADDEDGAWFRIFNEANIFVPRATPDEYLSFEEGVDYFALLFSGIAFSRDLFAKMNDGCPEVTKKCQLEWLKGTRDEIWKDYAPEFSKYLNTVDPDEWANFSEGLEQMARGSIEPEPFQRFELLKVSIAIQYIEIFLRKYDLNQDLKIDFAETVYSFDKFKAALLALPQVKGTEAESDPSTLLSFYTFFLRRGRLPRKVLGQYVELLGWIRKVKSCTTQTPEHSFVVNAGVQGCEYESSRGNLMKILAFLSNSL